MNDRGAALSGDVGLLERARAGDRHAFGSLLRRYDDRMRGLAFKLLAGDREAMHDALQNAYLRAYRSVGGFRGDADFGTWLHRIVYNASMDELRRVQAAPRPVDATDARWDSASTRPGPERVVATGDAVLRALATLPPDQRATVLLVDGEGYDNVTAAEILGIAPGTVASRLSRARAALRNLLGEDAR